MMANREEIVKIIEEALKIEESAIPLYSKHVNNTLFLSGFAERERSKVKEILDRLKRESENHKLIFEKLLAVIKSSKQNVY